MSDFIEYIVEKRRTFADIFKGAVAVIVGFILVAVLVLLRISPTVTTLLVAGVVYVAYKISTSSNIEYEYIFTNNEMDVDRIVNKKSRKRLITINIRRVDEFEKCDGHRENRYANDGNIKVINACRDKSEGCYYMTFTDDGGRGILFFTPNEKIEEYIRKILKGRF